MSSDVHAWLDIADTDIDAARRSLLPDPEPNIPAAAYHCQQAVEKLIKTLLVHLGLPYLRGSGGHDLRRLVAALPTTHPLLGDAICSCRYRLGQPPFVTLSTIHIRRNLSRMLQRSSASSTRSASFATKWPWTWGPGLPLVPEFRSALVSRALVITAE